MKDAIQMTFLSPNGYITPCPHREICGAYNTPDGVRPDETTYTRGCAGTCWWCSMFKNERSKDNGKSKTEGK